MVSRAEGQSLPLGESMLWLTDIVFLNDGDAPALVRALEVLGTGEDISNAPIDPAAQILVVPPRHSASMKTQLLGGWTPRTSAPLWVLRLDVPPSVTLTNVIAVGSMLTVGQSPNSRPFRFGKAHLPIFRALVPANQRQIQLAADLGLEIAAHLNVSVYNAGLVPASAHVEIHQQCDDAIVEERTVLMSANSIQQFRGFAAQPRDCTSSPPSSGTFNASLYVIVTVDQPSFSFISAVADQPPTYTFLNVSTALQ